MAVNIKIIDLGTGNLGSIFNMFKKIRYTAEISSDVSEIDEADILILPGVGAFDNAVKNIDRLGLPEILNDKVIVRKTPVLGICLGMQLLAKSSEEGTLPGLGWLDAEVVKFRFDKASGLKIPHMGWNTVVPRKESSLLNNCPEENRFYFVHSYHIHCFDSTNIVGMTKYGLKFTSVVNRGNIWGVQFHPEKSHKFGMTLLKTFIDENTKCCAHG